MLLTCHERQQQQSPWMCKTTAPQSRSHTMCERLTRTDLSCTRKSKKSACVSSFSNSSSPLNRSLAKVAAAIASNASASLLPAACGRMKSQRREIKEGRECWFGVLNTHVSSAYCFLDPGRQQQHGKVCVCVCVRVRVCAYERVSMWVCVVCWFAAPA